MTEEEMVGRHYQLNGHELEQALGVGDGQGSLMCCNPWGCKEWHTTEWHTTKVLNCFLRETQITKVFHLVKIHRNVLLYNFN